MTLQTGQVLNNRYRVTKVLNAGGFGTVYRAWDLNLGRACAIKENSETDPDYQRQFQREAQMLACLNHPNLPRVFDHFLLPEGQYLVMDFIEGEDLETMRCRQPGGALPEAQVMPWIRQVCKALEYLHSQTPPVIHRDIKPANIRITPEGKAVLVDFGAAKQQKRGSNTTSAAKVISPGYSPPEQYTGGGTDERSDIYALGSTLYTLLSGMELPESIDPNFIQRGARLRYLHKAGIQQHISQAILRAIEIQPAKRFACVADFKQALKAPPPTPPLPPTPPPAFVSVNPTANSIPYSPPLGAQTYPPPAKKSSSKTWIWILVIFVLLFGMCCVCSLLSYLNYYGETLINTMVTTPTPW